MPTSTFTICHGSGCTNHVYHTSMLTRTAEGLPHVELPRWYSSVAISG